MKHSKKANVIVVLIVIMAVLGLFLALTRFSSKMAIQKDATRQAVTESDIYLQEIRI